jgi:ribosomal protein S18 acetylase RimI-like enzyme
VPSVRRIEPGDGALLREVRLRALQHDPRSFASTYDREAAYTAEDWDGWARRHAAGGEEATFLAFDDEGAIAGLAGGFRSAEGSGTYTLFSMWVAPEHRRGGHGRRLVDTVAEWARDAGGQELNLLVTDLRAVALYERAGFVDDGRRQPLPSDPNVMETGMTRRLGTAAP